MAHKMAAAYQFACCGHSYLVILNRISSKFHIWIALIKLLHSLNMGCVRQTISKMADEMAAAYQFACCGHSYLVILNRNSVKFHIRIASINYIISFIISKFGYRFCPTNDNQDGRQNGCNLSV